MSVKKRKTLSQIRAEMNLLIAQEKEAIEHQKSVFDKAFFTEDTGLAFENLSDAEIREVAKVARSMRDELIARAMDNISEKAKKRKKAKPAETEEAGLKNPENGNLRNAPERASDGQEDARDGEIENARNPVNFNYENTPETVSGNSGNHGNGHLQNIPNHVNDNLGNAGNGKIKNAPNWANVSSSNAGNMGAPVGRRRADVKINKGGSALDALSANAPVTGNPQNAPDRADEGNKSPKIGPEMFKGIT